VKSLLSLLNESELAPMAQAHAAKRSGGRVIGFVGADIPVELIYAADAFALALQACAHTATVGADTYLESSFSPIERSIAAQWLQGEFDFLDAVIFSRASDSSQRLYYYLCELQRRRSTKGPTPLLYDLAKIDRVSSIAHTYEATCLLAVLLRSEPKRLGTSIERRNRRRQLLSQLQQLRQAPLVPSGALIDRTLRACDRCDPEEFDQALHQWLLQPSTITSGARLLLSGSAPADARLHETVESAGGVIVAEAGDHTPERLGFPISLASADPLEALATHYHALPYGPRAFFDRTERLHDLLNTYHVDAVICWLLEEEEALGWELPQQQRLLSRASVPVLSLTRRRWDMMDDALAAVREFTTKLTGRQ
jgi:benzoyl-CoA reductase/2-hydroxyglutaryl-CoA dehydratase subunit BcrC/BadD/HgdB